MTRQILAAATGDAAQADAVAATPGPAAATEPVQAALVAPLNEALAGAFPAWDLLPAAPFVRRVR
ncbi:hypothetical protein [Cupriavidus sp. UME77]|uniref:hypothetical protein n=1 Tax=Cupriavidus sp. UME77 TaxID=1862321 RepID=UPI001600CB60|nr:hypothetical protein [Cupriavidus sp. UME77]MBB1634373.1 hypothetical protein [Cupriavidus sp. UME77]